MSADSYRKFQLGKTLTEEQISFFDQNGYIHFEGFMDSEGIGQIIQAMKDVQQQWIDSDVKAVNGIPVKYGTDIDGRKMVHRFPFISWHSAYIRDLISDDRIQALRALVPGSRINENERDGVAINHYVNVQGSMLRHLGWHTDSVSDIFYGQRFVRQVIAGLCLDDSTAENGGLRVIPGTHKQNAFDIFFRKLYLQHNEDKNEVLLSAKKGDLVIHDGRMWHRVGQSPHIGEQSRRRVLFIALLNGAYKPKNEKSKTPLYLKFQDFFDG
ncbi:MAG: phytanoyl-CoA dioxygenase [Bacteroidetes bacterium]|nr:phytanoyl-CoA dioxygenase [Bacteroidota bacterium]